MNALALMVAYGVAAAVNVTGAFIDSDLLTGLTKPLLMPLLMAWLLVTVRAGGGFDPTLRWLSAGLTFAWFGDLLLMGDGDGFFIAGIAAFLAMQACYVLAITRIRGPGLVRAWKIAVIPYALIWIAINVLVSDGVGVLRIPVLVYSGVALFMAVAALDLVLRVPRPLGWRVAWGALVFVLSDALIAVTAFGPLTESATMSALIMATYTIAQAMIITGVVGSVLALRVAAVRR
jgi:uncharacterized membrane protein YhhN